MSHALALLGLVALLIVSAPVSGQEESDPAASRALGEAVATLARSHEREDVRPELFDAGEVGRRALGRHWHDRSQAERAEFGDLVVRRLLGWYGGLLERDGAPTLERATVRGQWAIVPATARQRQQKLLYRLHSEAGGPWRVYDVETNGRSRIRAYYTEFDRIIVNDGYRALVSRLRAELDADRGAR